MEGKPVGVSALLKIIYILPASSNLTIHSFVFLTPLIPQMETFLELPLGEVM
jgi:hypothetical protein